MAERKKERQAKRAERQARQAERLAKLAEVQRGPVARTIEIDAGLWAIEYGLSSDLSGWRDLSLVRIGKPAAVTLGGQNDFTYFLVIGSSADVRKRINMTLRDVVDDLDHDDDTVLEQLAPFFRLLANGSYKVTITRDEDLLALAYDAPPIHDRSFTFGHIPASNIPGVHDHYLGGAFAIHTTDYLFTTPRALLDEATIDRWATRIEAGARPTAVVLSATVTEQTDRGRVTTDYETFLVDGHHKLLAAERLGSPHNVIWITRVLQRPDEIDLTPDAFESLAKRLRPEHEPFLAPFRPPS